MRTYRILVPVGFIALLVIVAVWAGHTGRIQDFLIERLARHRLHQTRTVFLGRDQITVVLCGTGVPAADLNRASACTAVFAGGSFSWWTLVRAQHEKLQLSRCLWLRSAAYC